MKRKVITVDGLASTGKTTLSRLLAERLRYAYLSSGGLYRAVGYLALEYKTDRGDREKLVKLIHSHKIALEADSKMVGFITINGENVESKLRTPEVSESTSQISVFEEVRQALFQAQREAFAPHNLVAEGRDMGTVVFPDADLKFFIVVSDEARVERRFKQYIENHPVLGENERKSLKEKMKIEVLERDERDSKRAVAPTIQAKDAILVDNSHLPLTEVLETMYDFASRRGLVSVS